jgi:hypothetical protein
MKKLLDSKSKPIAILVFLFFIEAQINFPLQR